MVSGMTVRLKKKNCFLKKLIVDVEGLQKAYTFMYIAFKGRGDAGCYKMNRKQILE